MPRVIAIVSKESSRRKLPFAKYSSALASLPMFMPTPMPMLMPKTMGRAIISIAVETGLKFAIDKYKKYEVSPPPGILFYTKQEARQFSFLYSTPEENCVYVEHPLKENTFYPINIFHSELIKEKHQDLINLLSDLGATSVTIEEISSKSSTSNLESTIGTEKGSLNIKEELTRKISRTTKLTGKKCNPSPKEILWLSQEADWQRLLENRVRNFAEHDKTTLKIHDNYGITASFFRTIEKQGFNIQGQYFSHDETSFCVDVTYNKINQ